jgi:hypothetical protein
MAELIGGPHDERHLGADHREIDLERMREREQPFAVLGAHGMTLAQTRDSRIAGRGVQLVERAVLAQLPGERVLATSRADDQHAHGSSVLRFDADPRCAS